MPPARRRRSALVAKLTSGAPGQSQAAFLARDTPALPQISHKHHHHRLRATLHALPRHTGLFAAPEPEPGPGNICPR